MEQKPTQDKRIPTGVISGLIRRLKKRPDTEHEQALLRIFVSLFGIAYLTALWPYYSDYPDDRLVGAALMACQTLLSLGILVIIFFVPKKSVGRRLFGIVVDIVPFSIALALTHDLFVPWYPMYLWVTFGNGFRYGEKYLHFSGILSLLGFGTAVTINPYWHEHLGLSIGLLAALVVLPGYVAVLLKRLHDTRRRAEAANRAKSEFLARMSHEIRTPLNGIIGTGDLLKACELGREEREYADTIYASGQTLLRLIEDILDISKIEAGKLVLETTDFDLHAVVNTTVKMLSTQAETKGLRLTCHIGLDTPYLLRGDPLHLRQILINLVGNALKFTAKGSVELRCHAVRSSEEKTLLRFEIIDTGIGIPEEKQAHIFHSFAQADESTTRQYGGTGLGTAIAKQLVELMGGRIGFQSTPGIGTTFWFDVEFAYREAKTDSLDSFNRGQCRILRFTDRPGGETDITRHLESWGVLYRDVDNSRDAVRLLMDETHHSSPYEVLIFDRIRIDAGIRQLLSSLRTDLPLHDITVLIVQADGQPIPTLDDAAKDMYTLSEPVDKALLFNALHASHVSGYEDDGIISLAKHVTRHHAVRRKLRILIAEDNSTNQMVISRILERAGHDFNLVNDGLEALKALENETFDVVVVDMHMPGVSGLEVFKMHRFAYAGEDPIPFIMLTANATVEARRECEEAGIDYFLTKPISSSRLLETLTRAVTPGAGSDEEPLPTESNDEAPAEASKQIDYAILRDVIALGSNDDFDFLQKLCNNFFRDSAQLFEGMREALENRDHLHFHELAHALRGSAANLGLRELENLAADANRLPIKEVVEQGHTHLAKMQQAFERAKSALNSELANQRPSAH